MTRFMYSRALVLQPRIDKRRDAVPQDAAAVRIAGQGIEHHLSGRRAHAHERYFAGKILKFFVDQAGAADRRPSADRRLPAARSTNCPLPS